MKESIYVIITGEYSDWVILGYAKTEEEANRVCAEHNTSCSHDYMAYYREADFLEAEKEIEDPKKRYIYPFEFLGLYNGVEMTGKPKRGLVSSVILPKTKPKIQEKPGGRISVTVYLDENDVIEKAEKIALDAVYQYISEKSGL